MSLGAHNAKAASRENDLTIGCTRALCLCNGFGVRCRVNLGWVQAAHSERFGREAGWITAEDDVGTAAGHVRRNGHCTAASRLCNDRCFALMLLGIQDVVRNPFTLQQRRKMLGALHRCRANKNRLTCGAPLLDVLHNRGILRALRAVDKIRLVVAHHWTVRWNRGHFKVVDLAELFRLGHCGTGHACELAVESEVVLECDRCKGHRLALYAEPLLRFDCLVETLRPTTPWHLAAGELVNDNDLAVLNDVVAIALKEGVRSKR